MLAKDPAEIGADNGLSGNNAVVNLDRMSFYLGVVLMIICIIFLKATMPLKDRTR